MSAPNAGPPVTSARRPSGSPSAAACRSAWTASLSAKPDRSADSGATATAAAPSSDTWARRFCSTAAMSAGLSARTVVAGDDDDGRDLVAAGELGRARRRRARIRRWRDGHR